MSLPSWLGSAQGTGRRGLAAAAALAITGCASPVRLPAVPRGASGQASVQFAIGAIDDAVAWV